MYHLLGTLICVFSLLASSVVLCFAFCVRKNKNNTMFSILLNPRDALYVPVIRLLCFFHIQLGTYYAFTKQNISLANNLIDGLGPEGSKFKTFQYRFYCSICAAVVGILNVRSYIINCI